MNELKQQQKELFTGTETFSGNIKGKEAETLNKQYRFKIELNERQKQIAIPEVYLEETGQWKQASPGWKLDDVMDSKGLFLDFGQKKYIMPTIAVWDEIRNALNQNERKRS
tara:strand:- start:1182 stop:1514 length:333 start_codon:yes stop_codon:yes gene_type:complete